MYRCSNNEKTQIGVQLSSKGGLRGPRGSSSRFTPRFRRASWRSALGASRPRRCAQERGPRQPAGAAGRAPGERSDPRRGDEEGDARDARLRGEASSAGTYAVACFHDENKNGKCDTGLFGIPTEGTEPNAPDARIVIEGRDVLLKE